MRRVSEFLDEIRAEWKPPEKGAQTDTESVLQYNMTQPFTPKKRKVPSWAPLAIQMCDEGISYRVISKTFGVSQSWLSTVLAREGCVPVRKRTAEERFSADILRRYKLGESWIQLARECEMSYPVFKRLVTSLDMPRPPSRKQIGACTSKYVALPDGCRLYSGNVGVAGYIPFRGTYLHRALYEHVNGPIPADMTVDHICHRRSCINPEHLALLSQTKNSSKKVSGAYHQEIELRKSLGLKTGRPHGAKNV